MGIVGLEQIANENDVVLLDANVMGCSNFHVWDKNDKSLPNEKNMPELENIALQMGQINRVVSSRTNIVTIKEVIEECSPVVSALMGAYADNFRSASPNAKICCEKFRELYCHLTNVIKTLRTRAVQTQPEIYHPLIAITLEAAHLMPLFSDTESHYEKRNFKIITDELLVANAFALALQNKGRIGVVSYDSRIPKLIRGSYTFLLSEEISPNSFDFWETLLKNPISFYGLRSRIKIKRGEFVSHYILDDADEFPYRDIERDEKLSALVEECKLGAENLALRSA